MSVRILSHHASSADLAPHRDDHLLHGTNVPPAPITSGVHPAGDNGQVIKGLALRPTMPDVGGVVRSLLGVLLVAAAGLHWGGTSAATAAAGAAAIAGATALQDSPRGRIPLVVAVSAVMGGAVLLASTFSSYGLVFTAVAALWCFAAGMAWGLSSNAGLIAAAGSALLVTLPPTEPPGPASRPPPRWPWPVVWSRRPWSPSGHGVAGGFSGTDWRVRIARWPPTRAAWPTTRPDT